MTFPKSPPLFALSLLIALGVVLAGCGDDDPVTDDPGDDDDPPVTERSVALSSQALDLTADDTELLVEDVTAEAGDTLLVTTDDGDGTFGNEAIVGLAPINEALTEADVRVDVVSETETQAAEPTDHAAHISTDGTVDGVDATSETAAIYAVNEFTWSDASFDEPTGTVTVDAFEILYEGTDGNDIISIDLHATDDGDIGGFIGISQEDFDVNERHEDVTLDVLEEVEPGDDNPERVDAEIEETDEFFAMAHLGEAGEDADGNRIPAQTPGLLTTTNGDLAPLVGDFATVEVEDADADQTFTAEADGTANWIVDGDTDPTLDLTEGERYRFDLSDVDSGFHPFALRDEDGDDLIEQNGDGTFQDDPNVNLVEGDDEVTFTLTEDLAAEIATYNCTAHPSMEGTITVD